jgi:hypothetical protein
MNAEKLMAGRLLSVAVAALLVHGCLLPQEDQVFDDLPPKKNSPPRILPGLERPASPLLLELGDNCRHEPFSINVEDPDRADRIRSKWFVDPDSMFTGVSFSSNTLTESQTTVRNAPIKSPTQLFSASSLLDTIGPHKVTVVIADGEFELGIQTSPRTHVVVASDGGTLVIEDPSLIAYYTWSVTTTKTPCPP